MLAGRDLSSLPSQLLTESERKRVKHLDVSYNILKSLAGLECFPCLETVVADNNEIEGLEGLVKSKSLATLALNNNNLDDLKGLADVLSACYPNLTHLSLLKNPACPNFFNGKDEDDYAKYRCYVVYRLPSLKFLDHGAVTQAEKAEAKRVGQFSLPARPVRTLPSTFFIFFIFF